MKVVDARGLACPTPVVLTKKALEEADEVQVIVDNPTAKENVSRMARSQGCEVREEERQDGIYLFLKRRETTRGPEVRPAGSQVLVIASDSMGRGEEELGRILMRALLHTMGEVTPRPQRIIFFNTGVKLVVEGSDALEDLKALEGQGVEILVCSTCLNYFGLTEKVRVGRASNMYEIAETLLSADKVVGV